LVRRSSATSKSLRAEIRRRANSSSTIRSFKKITAIGTPHQSEAILRIFRHGCAFPFSGRRRSTAPFQSSARPFRLWQPESQRIQRHCRHQLRRDQMASCKTRSRKSITTVAAAASLWNTGASTSARSARKTSSASPSSSPTLARGNVTPSGKIF